MDDTEFAQRRKKLEDELSQIERDAGITPEAAEEAWDFAFIPSGVMGDEMQEFTSAQNNTLYFDNEHDDKARRVRKLYFGVADADVRAKLISKVLELDDLRDRSCRDDVDKAKRALWEAQQKESDLNWLAAAAWGVGCVLVGYWLGNLVGAIAGAVAGVFLGMRAIAEARKERHVAVMSATETVASAEESLHQLLSRPRFFTPMEAQLGKEDAHRPMLGGMQAQGLRFQRARDHHHPPALRPAAQRPQACEARQASAADAAARAQRHRATPPRGTATASWGNGKGFSIVERGRDRSRRHYARHDRRRGTVMRHFLRLACAPAALPRRV